MSDTPAAERRPAPSPMPDADAERIETLGRYIGMFAEAGVSESGTMRALRMTPRRFREAQRLSRVWHYIAAARARRAAEAARDAGREA